MHEVFVGGFGQGLDGGHGFGGEPGVEDFDEAVANEGGAEDAAVEEDVRGAGEAGGSAFDAAVFGGGGLLAEEAGEVAGDGGVGGVGQADFLEASAGALADGHVIA